MVKVYIADISNLSDPKEHPELLCGLGENRKEKTLRYRQEKNRKQVLFIRILSIASLCLTLILLVINVLSVGWSEAAGDAAYGFLAVCSAPMLCFRSWAVGIFLWGSLLSASFLLPKKSKNP